MTVLTNLLPANTASIETDTTGWTTGANTTLSKSTRFYSGAASLGMTATAAGAVTATISARVAVVAGTEYTAYSYWANVAAAAGRNATIRVDWYAAVSGGTALSSVTSAASALPNVTTWVTPPPILIATAPTGATYASVTVSCTGLTAGATVVTDLVSFGPPNVMTGNLLPYGTASVELNTTGWRIYGSTVLTRPSSQAFEGWYSLGISCPTAGVTRAGTDVLRPVTAGVEYQAHIAVYAPVVSPFSVSIRWYDTLGATVSEDTQTWTPTPAQWTRCSVVATAPPGAVNARVMLDATLTVANQVWPVDQATFRATPVPMGSLIGYNVSGMEVDATGWTAVDGCTISRSTETMWEGAASLRIDETSVGGMDCTVALAAPVPITPRQSYQFTPRIKLGASTSTTRTAVMRFHWYNAADELLSYRDFKWILTASGGTGWYSLPSSSVAPRNAASVGVSVRITSPEVGQPAYIDDVSFIPGGMAVIADAVPSSYSTTIALQGLTSGGYTYWGLWRVGADGTLTALRGPTGDTSKNTITGDVAQVEDYEAPLGVPVRYYLKCWTSSTSYRALTSDSLVIPEPAPTEIVLKDPGLPARQTTAVVAKGGQPTWTRKARQSVNNVRGRARPIVISDMRTSREGTMTLVTESAQDLAAMWWLLETGNVLLIQWPSLWGERDVYVSVGDVAEAPVVEYAEYRDRTWSVPLTEVDRPIGGATGSTGRTWQTVLTENPDGMDVLTSYASWLGVYTGVEGT
ncbi:hypothetical protein [Streptomyces sp. IBSNAI001]|uniref:hypothetical protein n=1 Tax=Streptomyces sp. IBSNAI001 TaxID=3457499 RepID=UPI003FCFAE2C